MLYLLHLLCFRINYTFIVFNVILVFAFSHTTLLCEDLHFSALAFFFTLSRVNQMRMNKRSTNPLSLVCSKFPVIFSTNGLQRILLTKSVSICSSIVCVFFSNWESFLLLLLREDSFVDFQQIAVEVCLLDIMEFQDGTSGNL